MRVVRVCATYVRAHTPLPLSPPYCISFCRTRIRSSPLTSPSALLYPYTGRAHHWNTQYVHFVRPRGPFGAPNARVWRYFVIRAVLSYQREALDVGAINDPFLSLLLSRSTRGGFTLHGLVDKNRGGSCCHSPHPPVGSCVKSINQSIDHNLFAKQRTMAWIKIDQPRFYPSLKQPINPAIKQSSNQ